MSFDVAKYYEQKEEFAAVVIIVVEYECLNVRSDRWLMAVAFWTQD